MRWIRFRTGAPRLILGLVLAGGIALAGSGAGIAASGPTFGDRPLSLSDSGPDVAELQRLLTRAAVYRGPITGHFGPLTRDAVLEFQRRARLPVVGIAGPQTARALLHPKTHTVVEGDNLWAIADRYRVSVDDLLAANALSNPNLLRPGDVLRLLPGADDRGAPPRPPAGQRASSSPPAKEEHATPAPVRPTGDVNAPPSPETAQIIVYRPGGAGARPAVSQGARQDGAQPPAGTKDKLLALTFNDGPDPSTTPRILELLRQHRARATFFLIGERAAAAPELVAAIAAEGHEIGNHGFSQKPLAGRSRAEQAKDLKAASDAIFRAGGGRPRWFRPPGGLFDELTLEAAVAEGLRLALWTNIGPQDVPPPVVLRRAKSAARDGAILLLKQTNASVEVLEQLLPALREGGFTLITLSELENRQ